ncbi:hypothetical protein H8Z60_31000 [Mycolicibacterium fortuitum]|nr:hypothetical protein [Mycolicibacterium fortuitum]
MLPVRQEMMSENMMMSDQMNEMMSMMRQHVMITNEIKRTVDIINERCRRMEEKMQDM